MNTINPRIDSSWLAVLHNEFQSDYFAQLKSFLVGEKLKYNVFPPGSKIFAAYDTTPFDKVYTV